MSNLKDSLKKLQKNLNILREREAKFGGNAPIELLNQIDDYKIAIDLTEQTLVGEISREELDEELKTLNLSLPWQIITFQIMEIGVKMVAWVALITMFIGLIAVCVPGIFILLVPPFVKETILPMLASPPQVEIVLDVSQRMSTKFDEQGRTKLDVARDAILDMLDTFEDSEIEVALRLLGGRGTQTCKVIPESSLLVDFTQDYKQVRQVLRRLKPDNLEAPLVSALRSSVQHLSKGGSASQTLMIYVGGDDSCGGKVQYFFETLITNSLGAKVIGSKTFLIILSSETVSFGTMENVSWTLAETAKEVQEITEKASNSLPPTPPPQNIVKLLDTIADLAPGTLTNTPRPSPTLTPTPTATLVPIAQITPFTATPVPQQTSPPAVIVESANTLGLTAIPTSTDTPIPTVVSAIPITPVPVANTPTSASIPALPTNTPLPTLTFTPMPTFTPSSTPTFTPTPTQTPTNTPVPPTPTSTPVFQSTSLSAQNDVYAQSCWLIGQTTQFNKFQSGQSTISANLENGGVTGKRLKLEYSTVDVDYNYSGWEVVLGDINNGINLSSYSSLVFQLRGGGGGEKPNVWLWTPTSPGQELRRNYRKLEATESWQQIVIPLTDFTSSNPAEQVNLSQINKIQFIFEWQNDSGTIYIDDLCVQ